MTDKSHLWKNQEKLKEKTWMKKCCPSCAVDSKLIDPLLSTIALLQG